MGAFAAKEWNNLVVPNMTVKESATGILKVVDGASTDKHSGKMVMWDGTEVPW